MTSTPGLGKLELAVLMAVARLGDEAYGLGIRHDVSVQRKHDYSVGAIYTTLGQLERKGLVKSWTTEPLPVRGGRSRRQVPRSARMASGSLARHISSPRNSSTWWPRRGPHEPSTLR